MYFKKLLQAQTTLFFSYIGKEQEARFRRTLGLYMLVQKGGCWIQATVVCFVRLLCTRKKSQLLQNMTLLYSNFLFISPKRFCRCVRK